MDSALSGVAANARRVGGEVAKRLLVDARSKNMTLQTTKLNNAADWTRVRIGMSSPRTTL